MHLIQSNTIKMQPTRAGAGAAPPPPPAPLLCPLWGSAEAEPQGRGGETAQQLFANSLLPEGSGCWVTDTRGQCRCDPRPLPTMASLLWVSPASLAPGVGSQSQPKTEGCSSRLHDMPGPCLCPCPCPLPTSSPCCQPGGITCHWLLLLAPRALWLSQGAGRPPG